MAHRPPTSPTRQQRQRAQGANSHAPPLQPPELTATQQWWVTFMGDRAFANARAAGKNAPEAGQARAKAGADIALSPPAEFSRIRGVKNDMRAECTMHPAQPAAEPRWSNRRTNTHAARGL